MTITPERTHTQRLTALAIANDVRSTRAAIKRSIRLEPAVALSILHGQGTDPIRTLKLRTMLLAIPLLGPAKVDRFLARNAISDRKTLAGLSPRQRQAAIRFVADHIQRRLH